MNAQNFQFCLREILHFNEIFFGKRFFRQFSDSLKFRVG